MAAANDASNCIYQGFSAAGSCQFIYGALCHHQTAPQEAAAERFVEDLKSLEKRELEQKFIWC